MNKICHILILLFFLGCSTDSSSEDILTDGNGGNTGGGFTGGGGNIEDLNVELITTYDDQTASFSAPFGNFVRNFIVHVPPNYNSATQSLPLVFVLHGYTSQLQLLDNILDLTKFLMKKILL